MASVGGKTSGVSVGEPAAVRKREAEFDNQAALLNKIIPLGLKKGIVINLHNHTGEVADHMYDLRGTLKRIPDVKLGPDLNWLLRAGVNPIDFCRNSRIRLFFCICVISLAMGNGPSQWDEGNVISKK